MERFLLIVQRLPLAVVLMGIGALAMFLPASHALILSDYTTGRPFFYMGLLFSFLTLLVGLASYGNPKGHPGRDNLLSLIGAFLVLPLMLAVPFNEAVPDTGLFNSWWEMVSSFTTTGGTLYDAGRLAPSLHLWRATVGWLGGFFMLVVAIAILAPLRLGGFEVFAAGVMGGTTGAAPMRSERVADTSERLVYFVMQLAPAYVGLTTALWILLILAGDPALLGLIHAMSVLSTSGITPLPMGAHAPSGVAGEALMLVFFVPALSRRLWPGGGELRASARIGNDPELRLAAGIVLSVTALLVLRHWIAAIAVKSAADAGSVFSAVWGGLFTTLSFLTTTGFDSTEWSEARQWSGLGTSGMILAGVAIVGGGVATTAGGVRLLRVYALMRHGERELERLIYPASVAGGGTVERRLRREGAYIAWIVFMLFAFAIALVMSVLSFLGMSFEPATVMTIAALTNTGPLVEVASDTALDWALLDQGTKFVLALAMVLGRLETLGFIALLNPEFWRS